MRRSTYHIKMVQALYVVSIIITDSTFSVVWFLAHEQEYNTIDLLVQKYYIVRADRPSKVYEILMRIYHSSL